MYKMLALFAVGLVPVHPLVTILMIGSNSAHAQAHAGGMQVQVLPPKAWQGVNQSPSQAAIGATESTFRLNASAAQNRELVELVKKLGHKVVELEDRIKSLESRKGK